MPSRLPPRETPREAIPEERLREVSVGGAEGAQPDHGTEQKAERSERQQHPGRQIQQHPYERKVRNDWLTSEALRVIGARDCGFDGDL